MGIGAHTGGFSDGPTEGKAVLQEVKATEKGALVTFLPTGVPCPPQIWGTSSKCLPPSLSPGSPLQPISSDHQDLSLSSPPAPAQLSALKLFTSMSHILVFAQAVLSAWNAILTFE